MQSDTRASIFNNTDGNFIYFSSDRGGKTQIYSKRKWR
jgi:Tol biopolymer transport system component